MEGLTLKQKKHGDIPVVKEGDILYTSWGYEQTNVDFYMVVRVSESGLGYQMVPLYRRIEQREGYSNMSGFAFPEKITLQQAVAALGQCGIPVYQVRRLAKWNSCRNYGKIDKHILHPVDAMIEEKGLYVSWYA